MKTSWPLSLHSSLRVEIDSTSVAVVVVSAFAVGVVISVWFSVVDAVVSAVVVADVVAVASAVVVAVLGLQLATRPETSHL